jgi:chromosome partitioning protein
MYTIAIIAEKGGVGKTTVALALAVAASKAGMRSAVIDTDPQATASKWTDRRESEFPWVVPTHAARLKITIEQAKRQGIEFLVIDTPPHAGTDAAEAARFSEAVVIPVEPHLFTLETLPKLQDLLKLAGNPPAFVVVNKANAQGREGEQASEHVHALGLSVCPVVLHHRAAHRHAGNVGQAALEFEPDSKAAAESIRLYTYTIQLIDNIRGNHGQAQSVIART